MSNLLQEINEFTYTIDELNEDGKPKSFRLKGTFQAADTPNGNKRVYPKPVLEGAIQSVQPVVAERRMLGELDHPSDAKIHLDKVSHVVTKLEMTQDGKVYGEAEVLPTASGKILESLLRSGVKLGISSRGFGSTKPNNGLDEVQNDYKMVTFDMVSDPSTPGAFPQAVYEDNNNYETKTIDEENAIVDLDSLLQDTLQESVEIEKESKDYICKDKDNTRFYIVEGEKDSYGYLNFHISHDYHVLIKNEEWEERIGFNEENLSLLEDIHGPKVLNKILAKVKDLGFDSKTLTRKEEE